MCKQSSVLVKGLCREPLGLPCAFGDLAPELSSEPQNQFLCVSVPGQHAAHVFGGLFLDHLFLDQAMLRRRLFVCLCFCSDHASAVGLSGLSFWLPALDGHIFALGSSGSLSLCLSRACGAPCVCFCSCQKCGPGLLCVWPGFVYLCLSLL